MEKDEFISKLRMMLGDISELHSQTSDEWNHYATDNGIPVFNQKSVKVSDLEETGLFDSILEYRNFLIKHKEFIVIPNYNSEGITFDRRYKTYNSIMEKLEYYCNDSDVKGKVSVNKCFNDLLGIRIIVDCDTITYDDIAKCAMEYDNLYCVNKHFELLHSKKTYVATHIYFNSGNNSEERNRQFRWELQIWTKGQESNNHRLHQSHRFRYRKWEVEQHA